MKQRRHARAESNWVPVIFEGRRIGSARVDSDGLIHAGLTAKTAQSLITMLNGGVADGISIGPHIPAKDEGERHA